MSFCIFTGLWAKGGLFVLFSDARKKLSFYAINQCLKMNQLIHKSLALIWALWLMLGCNVRPGASSENEITSGENRRSTVYSGDRTPLFSEKNLLPADFIRYARGFEVMNGDGYVKVEIKDPWKAGKLLQRYLLAPRDQALPDDMPKGTVVRVPLRNVVIYTAVHAAMFNELGAIDEIVGVCEPRYIKDTTILDRIEKGWIQDIGMATSPNIEKMIASGAEVIIASPFANGSYGAVEKTGLPIIECADYMETDPLGRAEWIKFIGLLTGTRELADSLFLATESNYLRLKALTGNVAFRPKLMTEMKYGNSWYVSGGESYMAHLYKDAGADYLFSYLPGAGGIPLSFETVLEKAIHADLWMILYNRAEAMTYRALQSDYASYSRFDPFRNRRIYGCNVNYSLYYEEVPIHPDCLLEELIAVFHPQLKPDHAFRYFKPLAEE